MEILQNKIILNIEDDFEFVMLIQYIAKVKYGNIKMKLKDGRPKEIVEYQKNILLTKEQVIKRPKDKSKDSSDYGD